MLTLRIYTLHYSITLFSLLFTPLWNIVLAEVVLFYQVYLTVIKSQLILKLPNERVFFYKIILFGQVFGSFLLHFLNHVRFFLNHWIYDFTGALKTHIRVTRGQKNLLFVSSYLFFHSIFIGFGLWFGQNLHYLVNKLKTFYHQIWFSSLIVYCYFPPHLVQSILLLNNIAILRIKQKRLKYSFFYTVDELWFFNKLVGSFLMNTFFVRMQDRFVPELVELSYPLSWNPADQLVEGVYQTDNFFFWSVHKNVERYFENYLLQHLKIPQYLVIPNMHVSSPTPQLDKIGAWLASQKSTSSSTIKFNVENALDEIYYVFHDHFRLTMLEELTKDPLALVRYQKLQSAKLPFETLFERYMVDTNLLTRICKDWDLIAVDNTHVLYINEDVNVPFHADYFLTSSLSGKQKLELFTNQNNGIWTLWDDQKFYWWYTAGEVLLQYYYSYMPLGHVFHGFPYSLWLEHVPEYALPSTAYQNIMLVPCFLIFGISSAIYLNVAVTPMVDDFMTYPQWYWEFRRKFYATLALNPMEFLGKDFYYQLVTWILIPPYVDWAFLPSGYRRRRLFLNCDLDFTRYIKKVARHRFSVNPFDTLVTDYFTTRFEQELSPLVPVLAVNQMKTVNKRRHRQWMLSTSEMPVTLGEFEPNTLYYSRIARLRADTMYMNGLMYLEQDWLTSYVEHFDSYKSNHLLYDGWIDRTHPNHFVDYYHFLNFPTYFPKMNKKHLADGTITEWYKLMRHTWNAGNWRRGEVPSIARSTLPINASLVARHLQSKKLVTTTLNELVNNEQVKQQQNPKPFKTPFFVHLLNGGIYYSKEDLMFLKMQQFTKKLAASIYNNVTRYLDFSFEENFDYFPINQFRETETSQILQKVRDIVAFNDEFSQFEKYTNAIEFYKNTYKNKGTMSYVDREAFQYGPEKLRTSFTKRFKIKEASPRVWTRKFPFRKRDVIVPTLFTTPVLEPGVFSIFRNPQKLVRNNLALDYRTGFADVNLTFFSENVISGENYDYLKPLYQPTFLDFNNQIYKGPLVKPYDPVVFIRQDGLTIMRAGWAKILFFELYALTTLWKMIRFLLRRYYRQLLQDFFSIRKGNPYHKNLKSRYLDEYMYKKIRRFSIYGSRSEYHRISFLVDNAEWEGMYLKYLTLRYGMLPFLKTPHNTQGLALMEPSVEDWGWRKKLRRELHREEILLTSFGLVNSDFIAKALNYDLVFLSRPEQAFFDDFYRVETLDALKEWYDLDTAYFKRTISEQVSQDHNPSTFATPTVYPSLENISRRPINLIRSANFFMVTRSGAGAPRPKYSTYLADQYANWDLSVPLNRELLHTFLAGGYTSTRQLPQLPILDRHLWLDYWENISRFRHRLRSNAFTTQYGFPKKVNVRSQLALSQARTPGAAATNEIMQFYQRGLTRQHGIAAAYEKFLNDWQTINPAENLKPVFTAAFWSRLPSGMLDYVQTDQDRIRFLKNKNLSFSAEQFARARTTKAYQYYARSVAPVLGEIGTNYRQKSFYWRPYYDHYLRRFNFFYRFMKPSKANGTSALFVQALQKKYGWRPHRPFQMTPVFVNSANLLNSVNSPEEKINILVGLLNQNKLQTVDQTLLFDYVYNDLSFLETLEPELTTSAIDLELSLPGTIVSPAEFREYWLGIQKYKQFLKEKKVILNTFSYVTKQDKLESLVTPTMGLAKKLYFFRAKSRFSFFNSPDFNPWEGIIESVFITSNELKLLGLFLSGALSPQEFFTKEELPKIQGPVTPTMRPQHTQPLFHFVRTLNKVKPQPQTRLEQFRDDVTILLNNSYVSPFVRKLFSIRKVDVNTLGLLRTFGFIFEDDFSGIDLMAQKGLNHQGRRSLPHLNYLPRLFEKRVETYAALISEQKVHLETNVLPPIVYAETPESFIDINRRKSEFEKERKYFAKRLKIFNDQIFHPVDYLRYPRLKERHRHREYFWYCHHFVNNWNSICFDPKDVALIGQHVLIPDLQTRAETVNALAPIFANYPNPVGLPNYMTTYPYSTIEMCLMVFNEAEKKRISEETVLKSEVEYIKKEYAGKYYKEIREELLEPLLEQLARIDYERQTQLALPLWPNKGKPGVWRYEAIDDVELILDTQEEISELQDVGGEVIDRSEDLVSFDLSRHSDYRDYQLNTFNMYSYSSWVNRMRYSDFRVDTEDETQFAETKRIGYRADLNLLYLQRQNNDEIIRYLTQDEHLETNAIHSYSHAMHCYRDTLGTRIIERVDARELFRMKSHYVGVSFVNLWENLAGFHYVIDTDMCGTTFPVDLFVHPSFFTGWGFHTKSILPRYKDQLFLTGYYSITQRLPTLNHFLTQITSAVTPIDFFGIYGEQSLGLRPSEWFDIYDPVSERLIKVAPNANFVFKTNLFLKRYTGFYRPRMQLETLAQPQGLIENLEHLASGYVHVESQIGRELAMTKLLGKYFGILPYQIIDFLTFATVWGQNWLAAIYNGSFVESHYKEWPFMNVTDGLFEITESNTKNGESRFRTVYYKVLNNKVYSDKHLAKFLTEQEYLVTEEHWREFLMCVEHNKSVKVLG